MSKVLKKKLESRARHFSCQFWKVYLWQVAWPKRQRMEKPRLCLQGEMSLTPALTSPQYTYASFTGDGPREDTAILQPTG